MTAAAGMPVQPKGSSADVRDLSSAGRQPARTFFALLDATVWNQLGMGVLYFLKALPNLLLPVLLAESIRLVGSSAPGAGVRLAWMYGVFGVLLAANIPLHMLYIRRASKRLRAMELRLRAALVRRLQQLSMAYHAGRESGRLQSKVLRDVDEIVRLGDTYFQQIIGAVVSLVFAFAFTIAQEPLMALGYLVAAPMAVGIMHAFRSSMRHRNEAFRREVESMSQRVSEMIGMVPVTRAHGLEEVEMEAMNVRLETVRTTGREVDNVNAFFASSSWVVFMTAVTLVMGAAAWLALSGQVTVDKIALYTALFQTVVFSLSNLINMMPQVSKSLVAIRSIGEVLECPDIEANEGRQVVRHVEGRIEFENITFTYPGKGVPAVDRFSLAIRRGECVAFVGESGSGKSTLVQLAIGFLRPQSGRILLDSAPMEGLDMRTWRRHIAVVPQQTILFSGTLRDNITYGMAGYSAGQIEAVLDAARLREFVGQLSEGLDTPVGENGVRLSGGQRQRIAIARTLLSQPQLLVMDEATSALDYDTERQVCDNLREAMSQSTVFFITHRLTTIRRADLIVMMHQGAIVETGSHEELMALKGRYFALYRQQEAG